MCLFLHVCIVFVHLLINKSRPGEQRDLYVGHQHRKAVCVCVCVCVSTCAHVCEQICVPLSTFPLQFPPCDIINLAER